MELEPGTWLTVEDVMKTYNISRLAALKVITGMQADEVLGRMDEKKGYPVKYG